MLGKKSRWEIFPKSNTKETVEPVSTVGFDSGEIEIDGRTLCFSDFAGQIEYVQSLL
jgi:hypothetical protein